MLIRATLLGIVVSITGAAAAPVVMDPNFNATPTTAGGSYYGIAAWGASGLPAGDPNYNGSYAGNIGFDVLNQWNNGKPGNNEPKVGFLANSTLENHAYIFQAVSGFQVGNGYTVSVLVNGRSPSSDRPLSSPSALQISTSVSGLVYSNTIAPVDLPATQNVAFTRITTGTFTATSPTITLRLTNSGALDSSILLSGLTIQDLGTSTNATVPEPASLALLPAGLAMFWLWRRRA